MNQYELELTILTTTYNRAKYLKRLYESLRCQKDKEFQWLIIDDGSTDDTRAVVDTFHTDGFEIEYHRKPNGGKHTAINYAHQYIKGRYTCIVDDDDYLLPFAVTEIIAEINKYRNWVNIKCFVFLIGNQNYEKPVLKRLPKGGVISNHLRFMENEGRRADCCEVVCTDVLKQYPFPEFEGERFMGEGYIWNKMSFKYDTLFIDKIIYVCEYLKDGLTSQGRALRIKSPRGGMEISKTIYERNDRGLKPTFKVRLKYSLLYVCYSKFAHQDKKTMKRNFPNQSDIRKVYLFGVLLFHIWKILYRKEI